MVSEGFQSIEEISQSKEEDISKIEAIDENTAKELISRSKENLIKEKEEVGKKLKELGVEETLINLKGITQGMLVILGQKNIKKLSDFAYLSSDELIGGYDEIKGKRVKIDGIFGGIFFIKEEADQLIMNARDIAFKIKWKKIKIKKKRSVFPSFTKKIDINLKKVEEKKSIFY